MPRIHWFSRTSRIVALCSAANFINSADRVIMPIAIVPMADVFQWTLHMQGWILSAFAVGYLTSQLLGSFWASKVGAKKVLVFSVLLWSITTFITPFLAHSLVAVILCRIILGFAEGLGLPTIFHLFAHSIPLEERSRAFSYLLASGSIGQTVASIICPHLSWDTCFYSFGALGFLWVLLWKTTYPEIYGGEDTIPLVMPKVTAKNIKWRDFVFCRALWGVYMAHFAMNWASYIIMQWLPTYLSRYLSGDKHSLSLTAMPYIVNSILGVMFGHIADGLLLKSWSVLNVRRLMTCIGLIGPALFLAIFCVVDNLALALILVSISMGLSAANSAGHLSNHVDIAPNHSGTTFAISNTLATIPGVLCGPLTAHMVTSSDGKWMNVFFSTTAINLVGAFVYFKWSSATQILYLSGDKHSLSLTAMPYIVNSILGVMFGHIADGLLLKSWSVLNVHRLMTCIGLIGPALFLAIFCVVDNLALALILVSISMGLSAANSAGHLSNHVDIAPNHSGTGTFAISNTLATIPGVLCGPLTAHMVTSSDGKWMNVFFSTTAINLVGAFVYFKWSSAAQIL